MKEKIIVTTQSELELLIEGTVRRVLQESQRSVTDLDNHSLLLSVEDAAKFLQLAPQTIYGFTSKRLIPFLKRGKKLYFKRSELEKWLEEGKRKSISEINKEIEHTGKLKF